LSEIFGNFCGVSLYELETLSKNSRNFLFFFK